MIGNFESGKSAVLLPRRKFMRSAALAAGAVAFGPGMAGCGILSAAFNPAVMSWFTDFGVSIAANLAADGVVKGLEGAWQSWGPGVATQLTSDPLPCHLDDLWYHGGPPVVLAAKTAVTDHSVDPMNDHLIACVKGGDESVILEPWAWQAVAMYIHDLSHGKDDDELAQMRRYCALSLIPCGTNPVTGESPLGTIGFISYPAINGQVEIGWFKNSDDSKYAQVTATGVPDKNGKPLIKRYDLPAKAA